MSRMGVAATAAALMILVCAGPVASESPSAPNSQGSGAGPGPVVTAMPPLIVGAKVMAIWGASFHTFAYTAADNASTVYYGGKGAGTSGTGLRLQAPIVVPPGSAIVRVDVYSYLNSTGSQIWWLTRRDPTTFGYNDIDDRTLSGSGPLAATFTPDNMTVQAGWEFALSAEASSSAYVRGAVVQYVTPSDGDVVLGAGNAASAPTSISNAANNSDVLVGTSQNAGTGVRGSTSAGTGVRGEADTGDGVSGASESGNGVIGESGSGRAVAGDSYSGSGVYGSSSTGSGVKAESASGTALDVVGKAMFSRSGRATVLKGKSYVDITVTGGLTTRSMVHATLQSYRSGVAVAAVRINYPSAGKARIYLTKVASTTASTYVAWFVAEY
jgi:hypothetical protein